MGKKINHQKIKKGILIAFLVLLWMPLIQQKTKMFWIKSLNGYFVPKEKPEFTWKSWFNGEYQTQEQDYIEDNIGFRPLFVKLYNQIDYSLFDEPNAYSVVIGKENYLYEEGYIITALGRNFVGYDIVNEKINKLRAVADTLRSLNVDLMVVLAPGKGTFYSEYIPDKYEPHQKEITNYEVYRDGLIRENIPLFDVQQWFLDMKETSPYSLFPRTGIHWSTYGVTLVVDSLAKMIEMLKQVDLPDFVIDEIKTSKKPKYSDNDIEGGLNLLFRMSNELLAYPVYHVENDPSKTWLKVLTIADSFYWIIETSGLDGQLYDGSFWYYFQQLYPESYTLPTAIYDVDVKSELEKRDVIVLMATDATLVSFMFETIEQLYRLYYPE